MTTPRKKARARPSPTDRLIAELRASRRLQANLASADVLRRAFLIRGERAATPVASAPAEAPAKNKGGRPPKWDWDGATRELVLMADIDGLSTAAGDGRLTRSDVRRRLEEWFMDTTGECPSDTALKNFLRARWPKGNN